jgi:hypothetical protein
VHHGDRNPTLYIVAVSKADQVVQIIRSNAADGDDEVEDLGRVAGFLVQTLNLGPGEFIRVDANYRPQRQVGPCRIPLNTVKVLSGAFGRMQYRSDHRHAGARSLPRSLTLIDAESALPLKNFVVRFIRSESGDP